MSFILDALRKSDAERQQQSAPGLASAQQRIRRNPRNLWIPALVIVLILNAAVFAWIYLTDRPDAPATAPAAAAPSPARPTDIRSLRSEARETAAPTDSVAATPSPRVETRPTENDSEPPPAADTATEVTPVLPVRAEQEMPAPEVVPEERSESIQPALPRFEQLLAAGIISTPPLHLDMHVFAGQPQKRFVFINMKKYREGDTLAEGPFVDEITSTGVILNHRGNRFTLERN
jgi:general secretion pathway protein B